MKEKNSGFSTVASIGRARVQRKSAQGVTASESGFLVDAFQMKAHRIFGNIQIGGDIFIAAPLYHQFRDGVLCGTSSRTAKTQAAPKAARHSLAGRVSSADIQYRPSTIPATAIHPAARYGRSRSAEYMAEMASPKAKA